MDPPWRIIDETTVEKTETDQGDAQCGGTEHIDPRRTLFARRNVGGLHGGEERGEKVYSAEGGWATEDEA